LPPPLILIGCHRSGTSIVCRMLEQFGLFVGDRQDDHSEAIFFQHLNRWMLREASAGWDHPELMGRFLRDGEAVNLAIALLRQHMGSMRAHSFLGLGPWLMGRRLPDPGIPWGFKDPRSTFTLPVWLRIFPEARVLHVTRHGVDVAESLRKRRSKEMEAARVRLRDWPSYFPAKPLANRLAHTPRCSTLEGAFDVWELYENEARRHGTDSGPAFRTVRYEDLLSKPQEILRDLAEFAGVEPGDALLAETAAQADPERAFAYRRDSRLVAFARDHSARLEALGFTADAAE